MIQKYTKTVTVIEPECDVNKLMSLANIMRYAQQMGSDHLLEMNIDYNKMYKDGMVFVVSKLLVTINRRPTFGEKVVLTTIPKQAKGAQFIRDTLFETEAGEKLAEVSIAWVLVDPTTRRILRPSAFDMYGIEMFPNDGEYITEYKIKKPEQSGVLHMRQVKYSDLDYNHHVNNAIYANIVCDLIPQEAMLHKEIKSFGILYQKEATFGQIIEMEVTPSWSGTVFYIGGLVAGERCFEAEIKFK
ncbi:acyl-ACP thioesterase domain-containing protein [Oscillospiraceae bacterium PP1C4]